MKRNLCLALALAWCLHLRADDQEGFWDRSKQAARSGIRSIPGVGSATEELLFGPNEALAVQKKILKTNTSTLDQLRALSKDALEARRKIEEWDRWRRSSLRLARRLQKMNYGKALLGQAEQLLEIDLNPAKYVPQTAYTKALKRDLHKRFGPERRVGSDAKRWISGTRRALAADTARRPQRDYGTFVRSLHEATAYDRTLEAYARSREEELASKYEEVANKLLRENAALKALIDAEEANMSTSEQLHAYNVLHKNTARAARLKQEASRILARAARLSEVEKRLLAAEEDRLAAKSLVEEELNWRRGNR